MPDNTLHWFHGTLHDIVSGAVYDLLSVITSCPVRLTVDQILDTLTGWSEEHGLDLDNPDINGWDKWLKILQPPDEHITMQEPNWGNSETLPTELWKSTLLPMHERLEIADGAVAFHRKTIANLRAQLKECLGQTASE